MRLALFWFNSDVIVNGNPELLFASKILLSCLHAHVAEKELDLLEFATREVTQAGAGAPQIVRCKFPDLRFRRELFDDAPDHLLSDTLAPHGTSFADAAENSTFINVRSRDPALNRLLDPSWYGDGADVTTLSVQIDDDPPVLTLLDV